MNPNIAKIKQLIASNRIKEAFQALEQISEGRLGDEVLLLKSQFSRLESSSRSGIISSENERLERAKITHGLLKVLEEMADEEAVPSDTTSVPPISLDTPNTISEPKQLEPTMKNKVWQWVVAAGILLAVPAAFAEFTGYSLRDLMGCNPATTIQSNVVRIAVKSQNDISLPPKGMVCLNYGSNNTCKEINNYKEAIFTEVPNGYFETGNQVKITFTDPQGEPYFAGYADSVYQLKPNQSIDLLVALKGLDKLQGIVKDFETGDAIEGVRISVLNLDVLSDKNGWWELKIEEEDKQRKFHTLRVSKEGYQNWEQAKVPAQTDQEIAVLLKRKVK